MKQTTSQRNPEKNRKHFSSCLCLLLSLVLIAIPASAAKQEAESEAAPKERENPETSAVTEWVPQVSLHGVYALVGASFENGWACICDNTMKGYGTPWAAIDLNYEQGIRGEEGAEVYVGANGILRFSMTDVGTGKEVSTENLFLMDSEGEGPDEYLVSAQYYGWDGKKTGEKELGTFVNDGTSDYYATFHSQMESEISAIGAVPYGDATMVSVQNVDGGAAAYAPDGTELIRYPDIAAEDLSVTLSKDGKVLAASVRDSSYITEIFTLGEPGRPAASQTPEENTVYTDADSIRLVQDALNKAGYDAGPVDGVSGDRTLAAIKAFREANGLEANTDIDDALFAALGIAR